MSIRNLDELTNREREHMQHEKDMFNMQASHNERVRKLELEVAKVEARWGVLFKLPIAVVRLPLYIVLGVAYCIAVGRKVEPQEEFWKLFK